MTADQRAREILALRSKMLTVLTKALKLRDGVGRRDRIQRVMLDLVNAERQRRGFRGGLTLGDMYRLERGALCHADYPEKFALYCAEVATDPEWTP